MKCRLNAGYAAILPKRRQSAQTQFTTVTATTSCFSLSKKTRKVRVLIRGQIIIKSVPETDLMVMATKLICVELGVESECNETQWITVRQRKSRFGRRLARLARAITICKSPWRTSRKS